MEIKLRVRTTMIAYRIAAHHQNGYFQGCVPGGNGANFNLVLFILLFGGMLFILQRSSMPQ